MSSISTSSHDIFRLIKAVMCLLGCPLLIFVYFWLPNWLGRKGEKLWRQLIHRRQKPKQGRTELLMAEITKLSLF
ncbi:hypothetical protein ES288_D09G262900v1 [Gossypium darwinii]|uniref:Uncharacterized protein n=1 Tax=Gossypium darwinii TaxID=34276 RepID=A0A5D2BIG4_GOSDA|nr:hypothetical protein ES288_D09G262900v1 [Gossypium darwinii]